MCGIAAISLSPGSHIPVAKLTHFLLKALESRGTDASGYAFMEPGVTRFHKKDVPGSFLRTDLIPRATRTVILHTRNSTKGSPTVNENNHPVLSPNERVLLVHNGVISNDGPIRASFEQSLAEVDSSVLPALIERDGWRQTMRDASGWAAVAWLDANDQNALNLVRRDNSSPMSIAQFTDGSIVMGSTSKALEEAISAIGFLDEVDSVWEVPTGTYIRIRRGRIESLQDSPSYSAAASRYKSAYVSQHEKDRLARVTSGEASSSFHQSPASKTSAGTTVGSPGTVGTEALSKPISMKCPLCNVWMVHTGIPVHIMNSHKDNVRRIDGRWWFRNAQGISNNELHLGDAKGWWTSTAATSKEVVRAPKDGPMWDEPTPNGATCDVASGPSAVADESPISDSRLFSDEALDVYDSATWWIARRDGGSPSLRHFAKYDQYLILKRASIESGTLIQCGFLAGGGDSQLYIETSKSDDSLAEVSEMLDYFMSKSKSNA